MSQPRSQQPTVIVALTEAGRQLAEELSAGMESSALWYKPKPFAEKVQQAFSNGSPLIFICATGIVVRTLAPVIGTKQQDPPVLVIDENCQFVIPLLSGHEGGANHWGMQIAHRIDAQLVLTTAKNYTQPVYTVGMGCERGCTVEELHTLLLYCLDMAGLDLQDITSINSIDIKADEIGLIELAKKLNKPYQTYSAKALSAVDALLSTRSEYVYKTVGVYGVAESAALLAAGHAGAEPDQPPTIETVELVVNKHKSQKATCAIARTYLATHHSI